MPRLALALLLAFAAPALAGQGQLETRHSEKGLEYSIRIPEGYEKWRGALLVIGLHGRGGKQADFMRSLSAMKFLEKAIIVCPQAPNAGAMWDAGDLGAVGDLIHDVQAEHHPPRTVLFGFSAGAYFSYAVATVGQAHVEAAIPHSGGLTPLVPLGEAAKKVAWYVIHGDADNIVNVDQGRQAAKALQDAGVKDVFYEELKGVGHTVDVAATQRAFEWVEKTLGPCPPELPDKETNERLAALEKAIKAKAWDAAAKGFDALAGASPRAFGRIAALAKAQLACTDDDTAVAAATALGRLGEAGLPTLKAAKCDRDPVGEAVARALSLTGSPQAADPLLKLLEGKNEPVAAAAAKELGCLGGDAAIAALVAGLHASEASKTPDGRKDAINAALKRLTGQSFETSKDWKRWLAAQGK